MVIAGLEWGSMDLSVGIDRIDSSGGLMAGGHGKVRDEL